MHPMILGSVQRRATLTRVHASSRPFSTNVASILRVLYTRILIYIYIRARIYRALRVCTSTDCLSRTILPIDAALPHPLNPSWPDWIYSAAAFISRRGNPSQSVLVPRTQPRRKSRFVTGAFVEIFSISQAPIQVLLFFSCGRRW